jgi:hypothetical protein
MIKKLGKACNITNRTVTSYACLCGCNNCNPCATTPSSCYIEQRDLRINTEVNKVFVPGDSVTVTSE